MKKHFNYFLLLIICTLVGFSLLFFFLLSAKTSFQKFGNTNYYFLHQLLLGLLPALVLGGIVYFIPLDFFKKWAPVLVLANIVALFMVFLPKIGIKAGGASRWIGIGHFALQPSEFLKVSAILYLSAWIASKLSEDNASGWKSNVKKSYHNIIYILLPFLVFMGLISIGLLLQKDVTTLGIITLTLLAVYFSAKTPIWHTLVIIAAGAGALLLMVKFEPYRLDRWMVFLHPGQDPYGKAYQLNQSIVSLGSGGFFGKGLGMSAQAGFVPQAMSDSIFAIIGEELGLIGCIILIGVFVLLFWEGFKIYKNSHDRFSKLTEIGIVFWISFQALINIASVAGVFPVTGVPLPFFSYGGSHLAVELIGMGLLLNISKNS